MRWSLWTGLLAALAQTGKSPSAGCPWADMLNWAPATADVYQDPDTGLTFSSAFQLYKTDGRGITFRIAVPDDAQSYTAYDAVVQMVVPNDAGWAGLAWGGSMPRNPLLVAWKGNGDNIVLSSRMAPGHVMPQPYADAQYTLFQTGTKSNGTHWQFTALCRGCTAWIVPSTGAERFLSPTGGNRLAFAYSPNRPTNPDSPDSSIPIHQVHGYWNHDFGQGRNADFHATVERLLS